MKGPRSPVEGLRLYVPAWGCLELVVDPGGPCWELFHWNGHRVAQATFGRDGRRLTTWGSVHARDLPRLGRLVGKIVLERLARRVFGP